MLVLENLAGQGARYLEEASQPVPSAGRQRLVQSIINIINIQLQDARNDTCIHSEATVATNRDCRMYHDVELLSSLAWPLSVKTSCGRCFRCTQLSGSEGRDAWLSTVSGPVW